jgi:hypothetical protein
MQQTFCHREVKSVLIRDEIRVLTRADASANGVGLRSGLQEKMQPLMHAAEH